MKLIIIVCLSFLLCLSGCGWFKTKGEKTAQELAGDGMEEYTAGKYKTAIESFEKLRDWYPFSKFAILAELKIADAYYQLEEYEEAIFAYEEFENLHPRNEATPYVVYMTGRCYFNQLDAIDRDQTSTEKALGTFFRLIKQFPGSAYENKSREHINTCLKNLAGHDFSVGQFYYKSKHYKAALGRFQSVISNYPDVGVHHKALYYIPLCEAAILPSLP
ncbi:outer membrane protein assembly factor BamD [Thermodesulfobacteriota bacterium]